jgi:hypothetical protein
MIRIAITEAAFEAIAATLLLGSATRPSAPRRARCWVCLERRALDGLDALRQPDEGYSGIILRTDVVGDTLQKRAQIDGGVGGLLIWVVSAKSGAHRDVRRRQWR